MISCGGSERFACANAPIASARRLGRERAVTQAVDDEEGEAARILLQVPGIAALDFALDRDTDRAETRCRVARPKRAMTIVPSPGAEWMSNSVASRRTAPRPVPGVPAVE